jgi:hypothetical protein
MICSPARRAFEPIPDTESSLCPDKPTEENVTSAAKRLVGECDCTSDANEEKAFGKMMDSIYEAYGDEDEDTGIDSVDE